MVVKVNHGGIADLNHGCIGGDLAVAIRPISRMDC